MQKWSTCEIKALGVVIALEAEYRLIRESKHPVIVLPDSKPVIDTINLIKKDKFLASSQMNRFLANVNKVPILVKHLSGKFNLIEISDHQSCYPSTCQAELCSIHHFIQVIIDTVIDPASKCAKVTASTQLPAH